MVLVVFRQKKLHISIKKNSDLVQLSLNTGNPPFLFLRHAIFFPLSISMWKTNLHGQKHHPQVLPLKEGEAKTGGRKGSGHLMSTFHGPSFSCCFPRAAKRKKASSRRGKANLPGRGPIITGLRRGGEGEE